MKKGLTIAAVAGLLLLPGAGAWAQDATLIVAAQSAAQAADTADADDDVLILNFDQPTAADLPQVRLPEEKNAGAQLYVKSSARGLALQRAAELGVADIAISPPAFEDLEAPLGLIMPAYKGIDKLSLPASMLYSGGWRAAAFAPRYANVEVGLANLRGPAYDPRRGFDVSVSSAYMIGNLGGADPLIYQISSGGYDDKAYSVGLNVGYRGFYLGGMFTHKDGEQSSVLQGYDVGLKYKGRDWMTGVKFGDYSRQETLLGAERIAEDDSYRVELGASYTFDMGLTVSGRLQYFHYASPFEGAEDDQEQILFFGTNLNF